MDAGDAVFGQLVKVKLDGLLGDEVNWNGIRAERIDDNQTILAGLFNLAVDPIVLARGVLQLESGIADDEFILTFTVLEIREMRHVPRDLDHQLIDLVESSHLAPIDVAGHGAGPQTDERNVGL